MKTQTTVTEPAILTANTYFWNSATNAANRRRNEERNLATVENFLKSIGLQVSTDSGKVVASSDDLEVRFYYSESCKNVYKSLEIYRNGKRSNITQLRKLYK